MSNGIGLVIESLVAVLLLLTIGFCIFVSLNPGIDPLKIWFRCLHPEYLNVPRRFWNGW